MRKRGGQRKCHEQGKEEVRIKKQTKRAQEGHSRTVERSKDAGVSEASKFFITICSSLEPQASDYYHLLLAPTEKLIS